MDYTPTNLKTQKLINIEWLKSRLKAIWASPKYCALCLCSDAEFFALSMEFTSNEQTSTKPMRDVVNYVFNFDIEYCIPSEYICVQCAERTIQTYIFITDTKKTYEILNNCLNDMNSKVNDINNTLTEENNTYEDSNVVIVVECDNETYGQISELTSPKNAVLVTEPIKVKVKSSPRPPQPNTSTVAIKEENIGPVLIPTLRVVKHPRIKEVERNVDYEEKVSTPNITLKEGKLVIEPLVTKSIPSTARFNTYSCQTCSDIFTTYRSMKEHEKAKHNSVIYKCRFCTKIYNTQQYLDVHCLSAHQKSRCRFCKNIFDSEALDSHLKEKHHELIYACTHCNLVYYNFEKLETHIKSSHGKPNLVTDVSKHCVMCLKNLKDVEVPTHKCKFNCLECLTVPCIHYSYLMFYREQVLNHSPMIKCLDCDYTTKRKEHLIAHVNREHLDHHPFTCDNCGTQFYTKLSLKTHMIQFHQDLKCQYCDSNFKSLKLLQTHRIACEASTRRHNCQKCVASFDTFEELEKHGTVNHSEFVYPCSLCTKEFPNKDYLVEHHARVHNGIQYKKRRKMIECTLCDITFKTLKEMLEHEKQHPPEELFPCKVCPKSYRNLKLVYIHKQKHYSKREKCPGCKKSVAVSYFKQHKALCVTLRKIEPAIICEVCGEVFHLQSSLKTHQQLHEKPEACVHCGKKIKPASMKKHLELKHESYADQDDISMKLIQLHKCIECGFVTRKKGEYENHMNKIHLKIKPYSCNVCSRTFCVKSRLSEHMRTHSTANTCYCSYCGKKFANKVCLKMHIRRHTGENPYECNICFERFRSSSIMKTHRLKKHQDKTIACPLCDAMYHIVAEMRFHVKKTHWKSSEPFDYKKIIPERFHHLFQDRRLTRLGDDSLVITESMVCTEDEYLQG